MNILIISKSFIVRKVLSDCIKTNIKNTKVVAEKVLKKDNLDNFNMLFLDRENEDIDFFINIKKLNPTIKIIVLDNYKDKNIYIGCVKHKIEAYISKIEEEQDLLQLINLVMNDRTYYDTSFIDKIISTISNPDDKSYNLTKREVEVLKEVKKGFSNKEIGNILYITENTVKKHITCILNKLDLRNRKELILHRLN